MNDKYKQEVLINQVVMTNATPFIIVKINAFCGL